jgi:hypothetical protein
MPAITTLSGDRMAFFELAFEVHRLQEAGEEGLLDRLFTVMDDEELVGAVFVLHDTVRGILNAAGMEGAQVLMQMQTDALIAAFMRFAHDPFIEAMREHIPWATGELLSPEEGGV